MPRGHRLDGNVLRDTANQIAAKVRRMERTQCPKCGRKGAIKSEIEWYGDGSHTYLKWCRWNERGKCDYESAITRKPAR